MSSIPKKIHYCWFGGDSLPDSARKCIDSWKRFFPGYEIIEWNEENYDVNKIAYTREAYSAKKYAFVSDYARFDILYTHGGIYFDTDVEVIRSFDDILENGGFMGCERDGCSSSDNHRKPENELGIYVAPGLGMAAQKTEDFFETIMEYYTNQHFIVENGKLNTETIGTKTTRLLIEHGLKNINEIQTIAGITIYPKEYFNPRNNNTGVLEVTANTHSIHWYSMSWLSPAQRLRSRIMRIFHRLFGEDCFSRFRK